MQQPDDIPTHLAPVADAALSWVNESQDTTFLTNTRIGGECFVLAEAKGTRAGVSANVWLLHLYLNRVFIEISCQPIYSDRRIYGSLNEYVVYYYYPQR